MDKKGVIEMGDRYTIREMCPHCERLNEVWYAPTSDSDTFKCDGCGKYFFVKENFKAIKISEVTLEDVVDGFLFTTNAGWSEEKVREMCKERLEEIKALESDEND